MLVTKRNGKTEPIQLDKIHRVLEWAAQGLDVSVSMVELKAQIQFYEGISTYNIHETLIKSTADLISEDNPDYQYMAARLNIFHLRKIAYGQFTPPSLYQHIVKMVADKRYDADILNHYSEDEINELNRYLDHWRDMNFAYAAVKQLEGKYLVQDRVNHKIYESPQMLYMLVSMVLFQRYDQKVRLQYVKRFYDACSLFKISLPTPIMAGVRTPTRQFSSCALIASGDSLDEINATSAAIVKYVSQRAGIGVNVGSIRPVGSSIRNGEAKHSGLIPFIKMFQAATKSCSQGGVRGGAATLFFPLWHYEIENLLVLKNNRGVEDNRARHLDYGVQINKFLYQRLIQNQNITLFSPHEAKGLYEAFAADQDEFERLYVQYENDPNIKLKKSIPAFELFPLLMQERSSTGRIYVQNIDHCNTHGAFNPKLAPTYQSNLCLTGDTHVQVKFDLEQEAQTLRLEDVVNSDKACWIKSYNTQTKQIEYKKVLARALMRESAPIVIVEDHITRKFVKVTPEHKIFDQINQQYIAASQLSEQHVLLITEQDMILPNGHCRVIAQEEQESVYDLTVEDNHNFFANDILVHNCLEITLPTKPMKNINDVDGELSLCTLAAFNLGEIQDLAELESLSDLIVRALDELLDLQSYPVPAAYHSTMNRRPLGIGVINHAYYLAKNHVKVSDGTAFNLVHRTFEAIQYFLLKASNRLAAEKGACPKFHETHYAMGLLPIDTYKPEIDELHQEPLHLDWDSLRQDILQYGLRNSTLTALMPSETSSQISNATNGIEFPRDKIVVKASKDGILKQVIPELLVLKDEYEYLWGMENCRPYLYMVAIMQKFIDQAISANTSYDPSRYENNKVPMRDMLHDLLLAYRYGVKTLYYHNTRDGASDEQEDDACSSGACKI